MENGRSLSIPVRVAPDSELEAMDDRRPDPAVLVIFGASGDLTRRKLMPALFELHRSKLLPEGLVILGAGRSPMTDGEFRRLMAKTCRAPDGECDGFMKRLFYRQGDPRQADSYPGLCQRIDTLSKRFGAGGNTVFYMAVPPEPMEAIADQLNRAGMTRRGHTGHPFVRVVVEKPFGFDLGSALHLNARLHEAFAEEQIFRIDHYLGKETVQNILVFRFANSLFEPVWNRKYIDFVEITAAESIGVEGRGGFYEQSGVLRDMVQNHLMQLLTLVTMEQPLNFSAQAVRNERVKALRSLRPLSPESEAVFGQYGPGTVANELVPGYRQENNVAPHSQTPTFAALRVQIDNWRWQGVPFYIRAGKRLARRTTSIAIHFQPIPVCFFGDEGSCARIRPNVLQLRIQPDEGISLTLASKAPGEHLRPVTVAMDFNYRSTFGRQPADAYERLILDCLKGDATLFSRQDEIEASWRWVMPALESWDRNPATNLFNYPAGSEGPGAADSLLIPGHGWTPLKEH